MREAARKFSRDVSIHDHAEGVIPVVFCLLLDGRERSVNTCLRVYTGLRREAQEPGDMYVLPFKKIYFFLSAAKM